MSTSKPSVITCDLEGRIETFNDGAEALFGYRAGEVVGQRRVSLFSPGLIVLGHVGRWLAEACRHGEHRTRTVFLRKDGTRFAAEIVIRPTKKNGEHIGYCGITQPLPDVTPAEAMPHISLGTRLIRLLVITRAPFLTATLVPVALGVAWAAVGRGVAPLPWAAIALAALGAASLHVAANTLNDYFDWQSGTDQVNNEYFQGLSGGSRAVELGLISQRGMLTVGVLSSLLAAACGVALAWLAGPGVLAFGGVGLASAWFYTAPPLRLAARKGLGELFIGLNFGPLLVAGTSYVARGSFAWMDLVVGLPLGLLTTAILWVNEFPDAASDAQAGKHHLVVVLGKRAARWGYVAIVGVAFGTVVLLVAAGVLPWTALAMLLAAPLGVAASTRLLRHYRDRELVKAAALTIQLQLVAGVLLTVGLVAARWIGV